MISIMLSLVASSVSYLITVVPYVFLFIVSVGAILVASCRSASRRDTDGHRSVCVLVLGDFGRSPRMQYHSISLSQLDNTCVDVVAYGESTPVAAVTSNEKIRLHFMHPPPALSKAAPRFLFLLYAPFKVLFQVLQLGYFMALRIRRPSHILIQNPPSIPTLPVAYGMSLLHGCDLVVDWHNYGYTILGLTLGSTHVLVRFSKWVEAAFGRRGTRHFCVTRAMQNDLRTNWGVVAEVLHDRPPEMFQPTPQEALGGLFRSIPPAMCHVDGAAVTDGGTVFTTPGKGTRRANRPALVVSSTSWTPDEDFGILLTALEMYETACADNSSLPPIVCIITGKGPMKAYYEGLLAKMPRTHVHIATAWLSSGDYPRLLGAADIGVSLHTSSSGLDLPMKVVDMFGCGLPVCAKDFSCLDELVQDGVNGVVFDTAAELCQHFQRLLADFPRKSEELDKYRDKLREFRDNDWQTNWTERAAAIFAPSP
eukprot:m.1600846 g.1600846  ORF g.1600846 m.1600846 type:complete len:481 (-) comp25352_c1_seq1:8447-9889(-)